MELHPRVIRADRGDQCCNRSLDIFEVVSKKNPVQTTEFCWRFLRSYIPHHDWDQSLTVLDGVADLPLAYLRDNGIGTKQKEKVVCRFDSPLDFFPPIH